MDIAFSLVGRSYKTTRLKGTNKDGETFVPLRDIHDFIFEICFEQFLWSMQLATKCMNKVFWDDIMYTYETNGGGYHSNAVVNHLQRV